MAEQPTDERAPLLDRDREAQVEAGEAPTPTPPQEKRTWWTVAWYIVFALLGVLVVAVFVKGIVDSDDVDVSLSSSSSCLVPTRAGSCTFPAAP